MYFRLLRPDWVHVAIVACGDRQPETAVAVKSMVILATAPIFVHIFTDSELWDAFNNEVCS